MPQQSGFAASQLPLQIALAHIVVSIYPLGAKQELASAYSASTTAALLQIVAREMLELSPAPATYESLSAEVYAVTASDMGDRFMVELSDNFQSVPDGCSFLDDIEKEVSKRISEHTEEPAEFPEPVERRSPLGLFLRRLLVSLRKLSFDETADVARQTAEWCGIRIGGPSTRGFGRSSRKLAMEDTLDKRAAALSMHETASQSGDYSASMASLRRFYDYQFPSASRGQHQHALLNLATFHYSTGGLESAKAAIDEAIRVARAEGDKACLQRCMSLSHRLSVEMSDWGLRRPTNIPINVPRASTPMEELWALKAALDMGEPVNLAFRRVYLALSRSRPPSKDDKGKRSLAVLDRTAWHAAQAGLWTLLGSNALAELHEDLALEGDGDGHLTALLNRAERLAAQGRYDESLALLLDTSEVEGLALDDFNRWAQTVWAIVERRATLAGDEQSLAVLGYLNPLAPRSSGPGAPHRPQLHPSRYCSTPESEIRASLRKAQKLLDAGTPAGLILPHVLSAVERSTQLSSLALYRRAKILLANIMLALEVDTVASAVKEIEDVWDQVLGADDVESQALGWLGLGKAQLATALDSGSGFDDARVNLENALLAARQLGSWSMRGQASTLLHLLAELKQEPAPELEMPDDSAVEMTTSVGDLVRLVGIRVAEGWK